ncbi:MAG: glycosyltransferase family 39 protein [Alphaproteobacteria bacterium]|nr:glycosyltransferase family 39 protein [Alphaproteobacteria bacterium]
MRRKWGSKRVDTKLVSPPMALGNNAAKSASDERSWFYAVSAVFFITVLRLAWLAYGGTDLYPDEAQYWLWSLHPAFGYYSKPPVVAWLIALTTHLLGNSEGVIRLAAPLLHFAAALVVFRIAERLYDARTGLWSALVYATLPGVSASAALISTDAPLLLCWAVALYAFIRARERAGERWWWAVGAAAGVGLLSKYAMAYWLLSALLYLLAFRDERRHLGRFFLAVGLAVLIYAPNFAWNLQHGFVSYHHTGENAESHGALFNPLHLAAFVGSQFAVFGPIAFAALLAIVFTARRALASRAAALLATFALPTLAMMVVVSFITHAEPNWAAPVYVSATVLVTAWLLRGGHRRLIVAAVAIDVAVAVAAFTAHDVAKAAGYSLRARYDPLHRLRGGHQLGSAVSAILAQHPGALLLSDDREDMADLMYYVRPHPFNALKWNGESNKINDQFDLEANPKADIGRNFVLVSRHPENIQRILDRFAAAGPVDHIVVPLGGGESRVYTARFLRDFKGYRRLPGR